MSPYVETYISECRSLPSNSVAANKTETGIDFGMLSATGRVRKNNEDCFLVAPEINLFVVADGMGGLASGEVASRLTVDTIFEHCRAADGDPSMSLVGNPVIGASDQLNRLASGVRLANQVVHQQARKNHAQEGMGAAVVAILCVNGRMSVAHVGDSRAYRLRDTHLQQLTEDHSLSAEQVRMGAMTAQEASESHLQNILIRAIGIEPKVEVDISEEFMMDGDIVLLCSDGLTRDLSECEIAKVLAGAKHAQEAADQLVNLAVQAGGRDNITAIVVSKITRS